MANNQALETMSKDALLRLIEIYSKEWLAMDGLWFQSVERSDGMDAAMEHDREVWRTFTVLEARRIKEFLDLPERGGLGGLARALRLRLYANINSDEIKVSGNMLIYRTMECRVQAARERKGLPLHPCRSVGEIEYAGFAKEIDDRIICECISCYPDITDKSCRCAWKFTLAAEQR